MEAIIIILVIVILVLLFKRTFSSVIYSIAIVDIFLRLVDFLRLNIGGQFANIFKGIPASLNAVIGNYTDGVIATILLWALFAVYILFEYYIVSTFLKKR